MPSLDYKWCLIKYDLPDVVTIVAEVFKTSRQCSSVSSLLAELTEKENLLAGNSVSQTIKHL